MAKKKPKYRTVTIYIRDDETIEDYMKKARNGYYDEKALKELTGEPQMPVEQLLRELEIINAEETAKLKKKKKARATPITRAKKKR